MKRYYSISSDKYTPVYIYSCWKNYMHAQLTDYISKREVLPITQSGFSERHSTTTDCTSAHNWWFFSTNDNNSNTRLIFLRYDPFKWSKAFNTLNHKILLQKLKYFGRLCCSSHFFLWYYIYGINYLYGRRQKIFLNNKFLSSYKILGKGVPQGSIRGPILFFLYILLISHLFEIL